MFLTRMLSLAMSCAALCIAPAADVPRGFALRPSDVAAFVGGSDVASAQFTGHLETLLAVKFPGTRFRNLGWEGDTVFAQPRDFGFPPLTERLKRYGITVLFLEFGRAEALNGRATVPKFFSAYDKLVNDCAQQTPRIVLVAPPPFETGSGLLPDLSRRNPTLAAHANAIRTLARQRSLPLIDLFAEFGGAAHEEPRLTDNGLQMTPRGHALIASGVARQLGFVEIAARAGGVSENGAWSNKEFETLRQLVLEKNGLWFNFSRPQNWAFLGGDRVSQPSSRDHRNPSVRWFPAEMEKYVPLIRAKEIEIEQAAAPLR
ncbi:MAG TPA: GDSL-type esterase/lipase family protein [Methylomirabilota bacterium]|nr:GDSL-type esterase/lipase family protein [Methylomirabilota bacterium]